MILMLKNKGFFMSDATLFLTPTLYAYLKKHSLREPKVLEELRLQTQKMSAGHMQICPEKGQFMAFLVELMRAKKTLDIGTFTGYSALVVALALPKEGSLVTLDKNVERTKIAKRFFEKSGVSAKISLRLGEALHTLDELVKQESNTFDFIFIDADKQNYPAYYEYALQLLKVNGIVAIDNMLWGGKVADDSIQDKDTVILRELNEKMHKDERISLSFLPIGDGLMLGLKKDPENFSSP